MSLSFTAQSNITFQIFSKYNTWNSQANILALNKLYMEKTICDILKKLIKIEYNAYMDNILINLKQLELLTLKQRKIITINL